MLATAVVFLVLAVLSALGVVLAMVWIRRLKERSRRELERLTRKRREQPLIFLSYRSLDLSVARACAQLLEREGYRVVIYDPDRPWDDEIELIYQTIETASAVGYLEGQDSPWVDSELELSETGRVPLFRFRSTQELEQLLPMIRSAVGDINLVRRLLNCHPHDRRMIAVQLFSRHLSGHQGPDAQWIKMMLPVVELTDDPPYFFIRIALIVSLFACYGFLAVGALLLIAYGVRAWMSG